MRLLTALSYTIMYLSTEASAQEESCDSASMTEDGSCNANYYLSQTNEGRYLQLKEEFLKCKDIECIAHAMATNPIFLEDYWEKDALLIKGLGTEYLGDALITFDDVVDIASSGLNWSGNIMPMNKQVKEGEHLVFNFQYDTAGTPITRDGFLNAAKDATVLLGTTHALHEGAARVVNAFQDNLGLSASINTYCTLPGFKHAAPLHTDRFNSFLLQTSGRKLWKIYRPNDHANLPVYGVHGDGQWAKGMGNRILQKNIGEILINAVLEPGDILYFPRGYPHETSTVIDSQEPSVALTIAAHTESLHMVYEKLLRCAYSQAGFCDKPPPVACPIGASFQRHVRSEEGRELTKSLPLGFMSKNSKEEFIQTVVSTIIPHLDMITERAKIEGEIDERYLSTDLKGLLTTKLPSIADKLFHENINMMESLKNKTALYNEDIPLLERQDQWDKVFGSGTHFIHRNECHPGGGRAIFSDYYTIEPDLFSEIQSRGE